MNEHIPIRGTILVRFENGKIRELNIRSVSPILGIDFNVVNDNDPWDYDDPDGDGVFNS